MVQFHTDHNLEDFLAKELNAKLGCAIPATAPTGKGFVSITLDLDQLTTLLHNPPTLWTVIKARMTLFTIKIENQVLLEELLGTEMISVSKMLRNFNFSQVNCRIISRKKLPMPRRQLLGLLKSRLQQNGIILQFQRKLPEIILSLDASKCRGYIEIGRNFAYPAPLKVHHTPLSPAVTYALFHLARQFQPEIPCKCLDPMCGNGTILLVGMAESLIAKTPFFGMGIDSDPAAIANARENLQVFSRDIVLIEGSIEHLDPHSLPMQPNVILTHPPYGFAPVIDQYSLELLYDVIFQLFLKFPVSIYGVVTPHQPLLLKLIEKYHLKTEILRPFQQKTLPSFIWVGHSDFHEN